jgi:hypothetical protein
MGNFTKKYGFSENHQNLVKKAIELATNGHNDTNHKYGNGSYTIHLAHVVDVAYRFIDIVSIESRPIVIASCYLHDSIEDARLSYNDIIKSIKSIEVAEIVRAVTNYTRGRNRAERMPDFIYEDIRETNGARFVKLCDRIANIEYSGKSDMYEKEHPHFKKQLYDEKYEVMFDYIEYLFEINKNNSKPN